MNIKKIIRELFFAYAPGELKKRYWDRVFSSGRFNCLEESSGDCVYPFVEKYLNGGSILDLGCGSGSTANELDWASYQQYLGVDISEVALERSRRKTEENCRSGKNHFVQADILGYVPTQQFDVILCRDSIYYFSLPKILEMLSRYAEYLTNRGVFIVRMWDGDGRFRPIVGSIESKFESVEKQFFDHPDAVVIVFRNRH